MNLYSQFKEQKTNDKAFLIILAFSFLFWLLAKIPFLWDFVLFGVFYEMGAILALLGSVALTVYFLIKWILTKFNFTSIYFYAFLLGTLTLLIMRLVESITFNGITLMSA
ncbi:MAG: hypothetical protein RSC81_12305 [Myroides sp.]